MMKATPSHEPVTIATFSNSIDATIAKEQLEAEGIKAFLSDEATANLAWHLTVGIGWIKLQVFQFEAERARLILSSTELDYAQAIDADQSVNDEIERLSWADQTIERAFRAAIVGLLILPIQLYSLWLLLRVLVSGRKVSSKRRFKGILALILDLVIVVVLWIIFS